MPATVAADVCSWFANRSKMILPRDALPVLDRWERDLSGRAPPSIPGWRPEGPGRSPVEAAPLIAFLRARAEREEPFTFNALHVERQGGRVYPFYIAGYEGPITISHRQYEAAAKKAPRLLLAAIRRDVRALLRAPPGWLLLELDFRSCHPAIGLALSGDEQLAKDLDSDVHQFVGDALVPHLAPADRRAVGKQVNNAMLFGLSARGLAEYTREVLGRDPLDGTGEAVWSAWWARYQRLAAFRDEVQALVGEAQRARRALEIEAPSGRLSRFSAAEVAGAVGKDRDASGPDGFWRTVFSACFRAVEGDLLTRTLHHFHANHGGGNIVLPIYDGALVAGPSGAEEAVQSALHTAADRAVAELRIPRLRATVRGK